MSRIAVISDVHADLPATEAILADVEQAGIERVWRLGDFCSGGPDPVGCYELVTGACELVLAGNHERFVTARVWQSYRDWWALAACDASQALGPARVAKIAELPSGIIAGQLTAVHGSLNDPVDGRISSPPEATLNLTLLRTPLLLFGHTHRAECWGPAMGLAGTEPIRIGREHELGPLDERPSSRRLLNPGCGCDAQGARWLELRLDEHVAVWHRTGVPGHGRV